jgi:hypothetical protein
MEVVSRPSIRVRAGRVVKPEEYLQYFQDWTFHAGAGIEPGGGFWNHFSPISPRLPNSRRKVVTESSASLG